jgi:hypothetical protein
VLFPGPALDHGHPTFSSIVAGARATMLSLFLRQGLTNFFVQAGLKSQFSYLFLLSN